MTVKIDEKMRLGMKSAYLGSLERLLQEEQSLKNLHPPEVLGHPNYTGRRILKYAMFAVCTELRDIDEKEEADAMLARYRGSRELSLAGKRAA